ncbi:hypothetical protein GB937_005679 [Aspergillus fischeri]|nr:hypothetical protein GB937_005679 [Aspergillus fischeri]
MVTQTDSGVDPDMHDLVQELDGLPLALAIAGAFLHQTSINCHDYLKRYKKSWLRTPERTPSPHSDGERKLESTWLMSLLRIDEQNATASLLLSLWAALDSQELWLELFQRGCPFFERFKRPIEMDERSFHEAMRVLCMYGFAEIGPVPRDEHNESRGYTLNRCVHAWLVSRVVPGRDPNFSAIALYCVTKHASEFWHNENTYVSRVWSFEARNICYRLLPHANHLLHLSLSGLVVMEDQYSHAYSIYRLADIFQKTSFWLSSPMFTTILNAFQIEHPRTSNMVNQRKSLQQVIALCAGVSEERFKDLHRNALGRLPPSNIISDISNYITAGLLELRVCRATSHPHKYICSRCLRTVCVDVCPWLLILGIGLLG